MSPPLQLAQTGIQRTERRKVSFPFVSLLVFVLYLNSVSFLHAVLQRLGAGQAPPGSLMGATSRAGAAHHGKPVM
jgi:hypothetical protein